MVDSIPRVVKAMAARKTKPNKTKRKKTNSRKSSKSKLQSNIKLATRSKPRKKKVAPKLRPSRRSPRGRADAAELMTYERRGLGARSGGQSGDTQGLSANPAVDSESVEELLEEGQSFEAEVVNGVENAPDPDQSEVRTREVTEDDVPEEYRDKD
jgi:hypothetical protein